MGDLRFPGETAEYRDARDRLLAAEDELGRRVEAVAELRRRLPLGGPVPEDYPFTEGPADLALDEPERTVRLSELFGAAPPGSEQHEAQSDVLPLYSFMFSPDMEQPRRMCTSLVDGFDGSAPDIRQRVGFGVVAKSPIRRLRAFARTRGWTNLRLLSSAGSSYNRDYHCEEPSGEQSSRMNVFVRGDGRVRHYYATEKGPSGPGQEPRHLDLLWPLWNALDLTPAGRGTQWRPTYSRRS